MLYMIRTKNLAKRSARSTDNVGLETLEQLMLTVDCVGRILIQHADPEWIDDEQLQLPKFRRAHNHFVDMLVIKAVSNDHQANRSVR